MGIVAGRVRQDRGASAGGRQVGAAFQGEVGRTSEDGHRVGGLNRRSIGRCYVAAADSHRRTRRNFPSTRMNQVADGDRPRRTRRKYLPGHHLDDSPPNPSSSAVPRRGQDEEGVYERGAGEDETARSRIWRESRAGSSTRDESGRDYPLTDHSRSWTSARERIGGGPTERTRSSRRRRPLCDRREELERTRGKPSSSGVGKVRGRRRDYCQDRQKEAAGGGGRGEGGGEEGTDGQIDRSGNNTGGVNRSTQVSRGDCPRCTWRGKGGKPLVDEEYEEDKARLSEARGRKNPVKKISSLSREIVQEGGIVDEDDEDGGSSGYGGSSNMAFLPQDLLIRIFGALSYRDLWSASAVCRGWRSAAAPIREGVLFHKWGKKYRHGRGGVKKNEEKALDCFLKGAARGSAAAMVDAGLMLWERNRKEEAVRLYRHAAEVGDAVGQCNYGLALQAVEGGEAGQEEAVKWFQKSALAGNSRARYSLALCLQHGRGIQKDPSQAIRWYLLIAINGRHSAAKAMYNLAVSYQAGEGVQRNKREAEKWMMKAAFAGHTKAQLCFAEQTKGHDPVRALIFYELAARGGEASAASYRDELAQQLPQAWVHRAYEAASNFKTLRQRH